MTRCCRDGINLKSSVYNQTGQTYMEQVSLHRYMCGHVRRVIQAKSVVEARNPRFDQSLQRRCCRPPTSCRLLRFAEGCPSEETIHRLAYDSQHHPAEIIRVRCRSKSSSKERSCSRCRQRLTNDTVCSCLRPCTDKDCSGAAKLSLDCRPQSRAKEINRDKQQLCNSKLDYSPQHSIRSRKSISGSRGGRRSSSCSPEVAREEDSSSLTPATEVQQQQQQPQSRPRRDSQTFRELAERKEEEALYAKFVYDITQEIVQNGLYTDRELREVFQRHLAKSSGRLNKRKMLYEIYQLKISLNMTDDTEDEEDEVEADLVYAERFSRLRTPKPPTPPKVLNENKVIEKLETFRHQDSSSADEDSRVGTSSPCRNVVLVDPNPEFLVTERDVLATLLDNDVEPEQIQRIYRNLCQRSKDLSFCEPIQVGNEVTYAHRLKKIDRCNSATSLDKAYMKEKLRGILRKDCTDFAMKSLSPELAYRKYLQLHCQEEFEKCAKWGLGLCNCKKQPCGKHTEPPEKGKRPKSCEIPTRKEISDKYDMENAKDNKSEKMERLKSARPVTASTHRQTRGSLGSAKKALRSSTESVRKCLRSSAESSKKEVRTSTESLKKSTMKNSAESSKKETRTSTESSHKDNKDSSECSELPSEVIKVTIEENVDIPKKKSNAVPKSVDENEEIEEEIETDLDETQSAQRSPGKTTPATPSSRSTSDSPSSSSSDDDDDDAPDEDLPTVKEESSVKDAATSDTDESSNSSSASSNYSARSAKDGTTSPGSRRASPRPRKTTTDEVPGQRYSSMRDYLKQLGDESEKQPGWRLDDPESSSDSATSATSPAPSRLAFEPRARDSPMRKRTSSGLSGYKVVEDWNRRLTEITSDFYRAAAEMNFCEDGCRNGSHSCAENCKFVRTNCRNLSDPTECLVRAKAKADSGASTDSS